jgi:hypothetical protein
MPKTELPFGFVELFAAAVQFRQRFSQLGALHLQLSGSLPQSVRLLFQLGRLRAQPLFPVGDFRFPALDLGDALFLAGFLSRELFDLAIKLRLPLVHFAMPRLGRQFSRFQLRMPLVPSRAVVIKRR